MPGGISLLLALPADIPTPSAGRATIFINSATGVPSYKDSAGVTYTLAGAAGPTGAIGAIGPALFGDDGADAETLVIPGPQGPIGATGATGASGSSGSSLWMPEDGLPGDDGLNIVAPPTGLGELKVAIANFTMAQLNNCVTATPLTIIPAPGPLLMCKPLFVQIERNITGAASGTGGNGTIRFASTAVNCFTATFTPLLSTISNSMQTLIFGTLASATSPGNTIVEVFLGAATTGGSGSIRFSLYYTLVTTLT